MPPERLADVERRTAQGAAAPAYHQSDLQRGLEELIMAVAPLYNYALITSDLKFRRAYHREWIAHSLAVILHKTLKSEAQEFQKVQQDIAQESQVGNSKGVSLLRRISEADPGFGQEVRKALAQTHPEMARLLSLSKRFQTNTIEGLHFLREGWKGHMDALGRIEEGGLPRKGKVLTKDIRKLMAVISGIEASVMRWVIEDVAKWPSYRTRGSDMVWFQHRLVTYLEGNQTRYGPRLPGLEKDFHDEELAKALKEDDRIKRLLSFQKEEQFISQMDNAINQSYQSGNWEEFERFLHDLTKGKNWVKTVREKFGDHALAAHLEQWMKRQHEDINAWLREFNQLTAAYRQQQFQNREILWPAMTALKEILEARIRAITGDQKKVIASFQRDVQELARTLSTGKGSPLDLLRKAIVRQGKALRLQNAKEMENLRPVIQRTLLPAMRLLSRIGSRDKQKDTATLVRLLEGPEQQWNAAISRSIRLTADPKAINTSVTRLMSAGSVLHSIHTAGEGAASRIGSGNPLLDPQGALREIKRLLPECKEASARVLKIRHRFLERNNVTIMDPEYLRGGLNG